MRRPRMRRRVFYLDPRSEATLAARAKAHKVRQPTMLRSLINGHRPGGEPGTLAAIADAWWDSRSPRRRVAIARNHAPTLFSDAREAAERDQPTIFETGNTEYVA